MADFLRKRVEKDPTLLDFKLRADKMLTTEQWTTARKLATQFVSPSGIAKYFRMTDEELNAACHAEYTMSFSRFYEECRANGEAITMASLWALANGSPTIYDNQGKLLREEQKRNTTALMFLCKTGLKMTEAKAPSTGSVSNDGLMFDDVVAIIQEQVQNGDNVPTWAKLPMAEEKKDTEAKEKTTKGQKTVRKPPTINTIEQ